jgi:hypothetical protein
MANRQLQGMVLCGPSGIRTHGLLNAIETRSQLRYGPILSNGWLFYSQTALPSTPSIISNIWFSLGLDFTV